MIADNQWHLICTTWDNADATAEIFFNAVNLGVSTTYYTIIGFELNANEKLITGQDVLNGFPESRSFKGAITSFNFYDYVLTADEIKDLSLYCYNSGGNVLS